MKDMIKLNGCVLRDATEADKVWNTVPVAWTVNPFTGEVEIIFDNLINLVEFQFPFMVVEVGDEAYVIEDIRIDFPDHVTTKMYATIAKGELV